MAEAAISTANPRTEPAARLRGGTQYRRLTGVCGACAALGWVILDACFELLFGPQVGLVRSLALGSGIGVAAGLLVSCLQWWVLRGHLPQAGVLIPVTAVASTLSGLVAGCLLYFLNRGVELYNLNLPVQGAAGAVLVGLATARGQWFVLRKWAAPGRGWTGWVGITAAGSALAAGCACVAAAAIMGALGPLLDTHAWPYILFTAYLAAGVVGGAIYGSFIAWGLRRVLSAA